MKVLRQGRTGPVAVPAARLGAGGDGSGDNVLWDDGTWRPPPGSSVGQLDDLTDVVITVPVDGDTLRYLGGQWINDGRQWEVVTDGEDVFVWDSDDLVHEWST